MPKTVQIRASIKTGGVIGDEQRNAASEPAVLHSVGVQPRRRGRPPMKLDAALDTSATTTAICIVNSGDGAVVLETTVPTDPDAIARVLSPYLPRLHLAGHEVGEGGRAFLLRETGARDLDDLARMTEEGASAAAAVIAAGLGAAPGGEGGDAG